MEIRYRISLYVRAKLEFLWLINLQKCISIPSVDYYSLSLNPKKNL